jgi:prepilin-type N-terminal cleavage/methylation domain-containing protein
MQIKGDKRTAMRSMREKGITLVELMVVLSIITILTVALGFSYQGWVGKYKVESQTKMLHADILNARSRSMTRSKSHFLRFPNATSYTLYDDDSNGTAKVSDGDGVLQVGTGVTADTQLPSFPKQLVYPVQIGAAVPADFDFTFNVQGLVSPERTICAFTQFDPDYDCITLSQTRVIMGKIRNQGGNCDSANCSEK